MRQLKISAFQLLTENDNVLVGHVFQQFYARDWFNCIQACHDQPRCISYNYQRSGGANGLCELNDRGGKGFGGKDKSLFVSKGFVSQQIREIKVSTTCVALRHWRPASVCASYMPHSQAARVRLHVLSYAHTQREGENVQGSFVYACSP